MSVKLRTPKIAKQRRQIHVSGVNMFNKCGMQFAFRYVQGIRRPPNAFMVCGQATDKAVTWDLDTKIVEGHLANETELTDLAAEAVEQYPQRDEIVLDEDQKTKGREKVLSETKDRAVNLVKCHHGEVAPKIQPFRTARKFTVNLDKFLKVRGDLLAAEAESPDISIWRRRVMKAQAAALRAAAKEGLDFVGEQDIVERFQPIEDSLQRDVLNIRDTKTAKASKNQEQVDADDQLTAYATASMVVDGRLPDDLIFDVLVHTKGGETRKPKIYSQEFRTKRDKLDVDVFLNRVANAVGSIQQGIFVPTQQSNWWCAEKWCAYTAHCPYFRKSRRPGSEMLDGLEHAGTANDSLLPILQKSVVLARKGEEDDDF